MASSSKTSAKNIAIIGILSMVALLGLGVAVVNASPSKPLPKPDPNPPGPPPPNPNQCGNGTVWDAVQMKCVPVVNPPQPPGPPAPQPPAPKPGDLKFDLETNWGGIPMDLRIWLAKAELASGIPGLARALGIKAWQAYRAGQALVSPTEAAQIAAAHPELCRMCQNFSASEGNSSKAGIDNIVSDGYPKPVDYANWIRGSAGLLDVLGSTFVYAGSAQGKSYLPFVSAPNAIAAWQSYADQLSVGGYLIYRFLYGPYKVLVPGANAEPAQQDSTNTWGNIFAAYATPSGFQNNSPTSQQAKANYIARAGEIGIDLAKVAYPWPPGKSYATWQFKTYRDRLLSYSNATVTNVLNPQPILLPQLPQQQLPPLNKYQPKSVSFEIGDIGVRMLTAAPDNATVPLVLVLHDAGANDEQFFSEIYSSPARMQSARWALLRGPVKVPNAQRAWWPVDPSDSSDAVADKIQATTAHLNNDIFQQLYSMVPNTNAVYVVGFGQGGAIAYRLAAGGAVFKALAIAGALPAALWPTGQLPEMSLYGVHGTMDAAVPFAQGADTFNSFTGHVVPPGVWLPVEGGFHSLGSLRPAIDNAIAQMLG